MVQIESGLVVCLKYRLFLPIPNKNGLIINFGGGTQFTNHEGKSNPHIIRWNIDTSYIRYQLFYC